ncbi:hypothetical protein BDK88_1464 [Natrinema hispanicum]|uniref:Uncharacterized protein n=1 Tax=Natrinema hispanicum TaxID=392421 RepID=A0A482YCG6_9EURY|nr:hypothetical protein [Natrinema hispanicum]RZV10311.1 hypothetical protein BDK88_1464 [Natrinema hispanicum]
MQTSVATEAERGIRYSLLAVVAIGYRRRDPGAVVNALIALVATYLPGRLERRYDVTFRSWQRVYLTSAMLTHAIGMLGPYDDIWWWDHMTHTHSATLLGGLTFAAARRNDHDPGPRVLGVVACAGVLWEIAEYIVHATANHLGWEPLLVSYGKVDTALDLVFDLVGALLVVLLGDAFLENLAETDE